MPANFIPTGVEYLRVLPEIVLALFGTLVMVLEPLTPARTKRALGYLGQLGLWAALAAAVAAHTSPGTAFSGLVVVDGFATFFRVLVIAAAILVALISYGYLRREEADRGEYYALLLYSVAGQSLMAASGELVLMFIGLEISSIASYILAGYLRGDPRANEAAVKYFLLGSFATAFFLYGIALLYGVTGSTLLEPIGVVLRGRAGASVLVGVAAALMLTGLAFKVSVAPFQVWAPDVYQGAPAPVAAFLSAGPKAAAFAIFMRVWFTAFGPVSDRWQGVLWASALATMVIGNFAALTQSNIKRLLGYSSIAHAGYVLVAITAHSELGTAAVMFYLAAYVFMNVGAFAVVGWLAGRGERRLEIDDLSGLSVRQPVTAALMALFLISLIGVPLTGGFFGKFYVFRAALDAGLGWLTVLGLLNSAVAAYYYLRILVVMYMRAPAEAGDPLPPPGAALRLALAACAAGTLLLGLYPSAILGFIHSAAGVK